MTAAQWADRLRLFLAAVLFALAATILANGLCVLAMGYGGADLSMRWCEQQYILRHKNPFDVYASLLAARDRPIDQTTQVEPDLGIPTPSYPPWAYGTGLIFMWPSDPSTARHCFVAVNVLLLAFMAWWTLKGSGADLQLGFLTMTVTIGTDSVCSTLAIGQFGVVVIGCLIVSYWFEAKNRPILSGLFLGFALLKPTLSFPFLLAYLIKKRWITLAVACAYTILASTVVSALVRTDPITMLLQMESSGVEWGITHYTGNSDPAMLSSVLGIHPRFALRSSAVISLIVALGLMWFFRQQSMMILFAIAGITGRLWVSHFHYDDLIVLFVLFALTEALQARFSVGAALAYGVIWATLWLPQFKYSNLFVEYRPWVNSWCDRFLLLCQVISLGLLLFAVRRNHTDTDRPC